MPIAYPDSVTTLPDTPVTIPVLANDGGSGLTLTGLDGPSFGSVTINPDQTLVYSPAAGFIGTDSFTYTVSDADGATATGLVTILVAEANRAPVALDDEAVVAPGSVVAIPVLANDNDPDGDPLLIATLEMPEHGGISVDRDQTIRYAAPAGFTGTERFAYTVTDGRGGIAHAIVRVEVATPNTAPTATRDRVTTPAGTPVLIEALANDADPDGDALAITALSLPGHGSVEVIERHRLLYTPAPGFVGRDSWTYRVSDGRGGSAEGHIDVDVVAPNTAPVVTADTAVTEAGAPVTIDILGNDSDPDGDALDLVGLDLPLKGTLVVNPDRTVTYTPATGALGSDSFAYTVSDGAGGTASGLVTIDILEPSAPDAYLNGYAYRRRVVVPKGSVTGRHDGFPFLVRETGPWLRSRAAGGHVESEVGFDLRFELEDGTKLEHDLGHYDPVAGELVAWVRLPSLSEAADTSFHLYYGKAGLVRSEAEPDRVWRDYLAVWHLPGGQDRSGRGRDLVPRDVGSAPGVAGPAGDFNGETSELVQDDPAWLDGHAEVTAQLWLRSDRVDTDRGALVVGSVTGKDSDCGLVIRHAATGFRSQLPRCFVVEMALHETALDRVMRDRLESPANSATDRPTALAFQWRSGELPRLVLDGKLVEPASVDGPPRTGTTRFNRGSLRIGTGSREPIAGLGGKWDGLVGAVRFRAAVLSEAWLAAEHGNQSMPHGFYGLGGEEPFAGAPAPVAMPVRAAVTTGGSVLLDVAAAALNPTGASLAIAELGPPASGTAAIEGGKIRYTAAAGFTGQVAFPYTLTDGSATSGGMASVTVEAATAPAVSAPYGGRWWGCMEVFDNAANINTKNRAAMAWMCRYGGRLTAWRAWIKRRPWNNTSSDYSRGDGGKYRFYLHEATLVNGVWRPTGPALGRTNVNAGHTAPLAISIAGKTPEDGWRNYDVPEFLTFTFEAPVAVEAGRRYWLEFRNETPGVGHSAWDNAIVEQKFPRDLTSGLYFAGDEFYKDDVGTGAWTRLAHSRGPNEAIYEDGAVEGSFVSSAGWQGRIDLTSQTRVRQLFRLPAPVAVDALCARIYYKGGIPGALVATLSEGGREIVRLRLTPYGYQQLPPSWPSDRPHYATETRDGTVPSAWPAVPWVAPLPQALSLQAGKDYALALHAESGAYRVGQMSVWPGGNIHKCWTPDKAGCRLQVSTDGGVTWESTNNQISLALRLMA